jgi:hypothetical protein
MRRPKGVPEAQDDQSWSRRSKLLASQLSDFHQRFLEVLEFQLTLGRLGHYCLIDSVTSTNLTDPYRKLLYRYHLFYATAEHHVYKSDSSC